MNKVNTGIKTLFSSSSEKELYEKPDTFWSEFPSFNHNNDIFDRK